MFKKAAILKKCSRTPFAVCSPSVLSLGASIGADLGNLFLASTAFHASPFTDFAPELLHCIFRLCSHSDLASLSQVNFTFRQAAEDTLYRHIYISFYPFDLIPDKTWRSWAITEKSLFHTLASNPQKAALITSFHIHSEYTGPYNATQANCSILGRIADALHNAPDLVDLRIMVDQRSDNSKGKLSEVIINGCFRLHTLFCDSFHDLEGIIVSQKHLRLLGIYHIRGSSYSSSDATDLIKNLRNHRNLPGIFLLGSWGSLNNLSRLTLFPELCLPGQAFTLCRDIATSLGQDLDKRYDIRSMDGRHGRLEIQVVDFSYEKTAIICEMVEAMAECFVGHHALSMGVQTSSVEGIVSKPWMIPGLLTSISRFKQLQRLSFYVYHGDDSLRQVAMDLRSLLLNELIPTCPTLVAASVDSSETAHMTLDSGWDVIIDYIDYSGQEVHSDTSEHGSDDD